MQWYLLLPLLALCPAASSLGNIETTFGIPYTKPFLRFQDPEAAVNAVVGNSITRGPIQPQSPSRLELVTGPLPPGTGPQDEATSGVLSVYRPANASGLPIVAWLHGGAFVTGGSEVPWYDGSRLAADGNVVVVTISYRLGVFGLLQNSSRTTEPTTRDVIFGLEWVRRNAVRLGGDPDNITVFGQSAGAYMVQVLSDLRPDLFDKAIIQSSPADVALTNDQALKVRQAVEQSLGNVGLQAASVAQLLRAQSAALAQNSDLNLAFAPISRDGLPPGGRVAASKKKQILVAWNQDDGSVFAELRLRDMNVPSLVRAGLLPVIKGAVTRSVFEKPALDLAKRFRAQGHTVTAFKHTWVPKGFTYLGATHCVDLPLVWGDEEAWRAAPMLGSTPWSEWERRGREYRQALGRFAKDGTAPASVNGRMTLA